MKAKQVIALDWPTDIQIITEALRAENRVLVPDREDPSVLRVVRGVTSAEQQLQAMNARVYAMSKADQDRWYAEHPIIETTPAVPPRGCGEHHGGECMSEHPYN